MLSTDIPETAFGTSLYLNTLSSYVIVGSVSYSTEGIKSCTGSEQSPWPVPSGTSEATLQAGVMDMGIWDEGAQIWEQADSGRAF